MNSEKPLERTLWAEGPALRNWWPRLALAALLLAGSAALYVYGGGAWIGLPLGGAVSLVCASWIARKSSRYVLSSERVVAVEGLLSIQRREIELSDIRHLNLQQTFRQRLLDVGDIQIESAGGAGVEILVAGVARPAEVMERVRQARLAGPKSSTRVSA